MPCEARRRLGSETDKGPEILMNHLFGGVAPFPGGNIIGRQLAGSLIAGLEPMTGGIMPIAVILELWFLL